jgi:two-component system OmpR family response regulator
MFPTSLALVDDDAEYSEFLAEHLAEKAIAVEVFGDSSDLLAAPSAYGFDFYCVDLMLPGVDGLELIRILRRRTDVGILVVSGRLAPDVFDQVITAGADMYLAKPVRFEQVVLAVNAVHRRNAVSLQQTSKWKLDRRASELVAPDGSRIDLSPSDLIVMECFFELKGSVLSRELLRERLGRSSDDSGNALNATIYRLRRRIERATPMLVPLQSLSRVGYVFKAELTVI